MEYRRLGKTNFSVSEIGLGCEHLQGMSYDGIKRVVDAAIDAGVNIFDVFMSEPQVRSDIGRALRDRDEDVYIQGHLGAAWENGQYCRTRSIEKCKRFFDDLLERLGRDSIEFGMLHFVDTEEDFQSVFNTGVIDYAMALKRTGKIKALGMSSHNPATAIKAVETGVIDLLMFSVNPAYDMLPDTVDIDRLFAEETFMSDSLKGIDPIRARLYETCEKMDVGITVMKGYAGGTLLDAGKSPFGQALSAIQCCHYALTRPSVASVLVGCRTVSEVEIATRYSNAPAEEKDYSVVLASTPKYSLLGSCMYCNHCLPCPSLIDVAQVNKYLDVVPTGQKPAPTVSEHYMALEAHGSDCIACGQCEQRCPFAVKVMQRMDEAAQVFGK